MSDMCVMYFHIVEMFALLLRAFIFLKIVSNTLVFKCYESRMHFTKKEIQIKIVTMSRCQTSRFFFAIWCVNEEHSKDPVNLENN